MSDERLPDPAPPSLYRLAPLLVARLVGGYLVLFAVLIVAATVVVAVAGWSGDILVVVLGVGLVALFVGAGWLRSRAFVVRLDDEGYEVRMVRGAGVRAAAWGEVREAATATPHDIPVLVLHLRDGRTTTVPVEALAGDRERFAADVIARLDAATRTQG